MDSLLIVLVVIGLVMILAGIARMRSNKKQQSWDDIDHNVLFSKSGEAAAVDMDEGVGEVRVIGRNPDVSEAISADKKEPDLGAGMQVDFDEEERQSHQHAAKPALQERASSILNKIKGQPETTAEPVEAPVVRAYSKEAPDQVIAVNVMAHEGQFFDGPLLVAAVEALGMQHGDMDIFHFQENGSTQFSLVNMVKPGIFKPDEIEGLRTPGVSLFFQLPTLDAANGMDVFDSMLTTATKLAEQLDGELRDETRSVLTLSAIDLQKQKIAEYNLKWLRSA